MSAPTPLPRSEWPALPEPWEWVSEPTFLAARKRTGEFAQVWIRTAGVAAIVVEGSPPLEIVAAALAVAGYKSPREVALEAEVARLEERIAKCAALFGVPDGGRYLNDWEEKARFVCVSRLRAEFAALRAECDALAAEIDETRAHAGTMAHQMFEERVRADALAEVARRFVMDVHVALAGGRERSEALAKTARAVSVIAVKAAEELDVLLSPAPAPESTVRAPEGREEVPGGPVPQAARSVTPGAAQVAPAAPVRPERKMLPCAWCGEPACAETSEAERARPERDTLSPVQVLAREADERLDLVAGLLRRFDRVPQSDYACPECVPGGDLVREDFRCEVHSALAAVWSGPLPPLAEDIASAEERTGRMLATVGARVRRWYGDREDYEAFAARPEPETPASILGGALALSPVPTEEGVVARWLRMVPRLDWRVAEALEPARAMGTATATEPADIPAQAPTVCPLCSLRPVTTDGRCAECAAEQAQGGGA